MSFVKNPYKNFNNYVLRTPLFSGDVFKTIARLSNNYTPPEEACNTFRALYTALDEFEQDLHQHIHLENNILHPKASALEKSLAQ